MISIGSAQIGIAGEYIMNNVYSPANNKGDYGIYNILFRNHRYYWQDCIQLCREL